MISKFLLAIAFIAKYDHIFTAGFLRYQPHSPFSNHDMLRVVLRCRIMLQNYIHLSETNRYGF